MKLLYIALSISLMTSLGCASDSKKEMLGTQKNIFADFYVRYLEAEREIKAEASFKTGDKLTKARSMVMSNVRFENNEMKTQSLSSQLGGLRHNFRIIGTPKDQYTFEFSREQLGTFKHTAKMNLLSGFNIQQNLIDKSNGVTLSWKGSPLSNQQTLILLITNTNNKAQSLEIKGPTVKPEFFFSSEQLTALENGTASVMIIQKQSARSIDGLINKFTEMEFYHKAFDVSIQ